MKTPNPSGFGLEDPPPVLLPSTLQGHCLVCIWTWIWQLAGGAQVNQFDPNWLPTGAPKKADVPQKSSFLICKTLKHIIKYTEREEETIQIFSGKKALSSVVPSFVAADSLKKVFGWKSTTNQLISEAFFQHLCRCDWRAWISKDVDLWYGPQGGGCHHNGNQQTCLRWKPEHHLQTNFFGVPCFFLIDFEWFLGGFLMISFEGDESCDSTWGWIPRDGASLPSWAHGHCEDAQIQQHLVGDRRKRYMCRKGWMVKHVESRYFHTTLYGRKVLGLDTFKKKSVESGEQSRCKTA